jgi:hypothetical protein
MAGVKPANAPDGGWDKLFRPANQMVDHDRRLFTYYRFPRARSPLNVAKANKINANLPGLSLSLPGGDCPPGSLEYGLQSPGQKMALPRLGGAANNNSRKI